MKHLRTKLLNLAFDLLYSRFVFFHELAGRVLYGPAWHARRLACLAQLDGHRAVIDVGAGEGRLVAAASRRAIGLRGVEPSLVMRRSAMRRGVWLASGSSCRLPLHAGSVDAIVVTYPGRWILGVETWREFRRVMSNDAAVVVLLGGTYERGPWARTRGLFARAAYGPGDVQRLEYSMAADYGIDLNIEVLNDHWGRLFVLRGRSN